VGKKSVPDGEKQHAGQDHQPTQRRQHEAPLRQDQGQKPAIAIGAAWRIGARKSRKIRRLHPPGDFLARSEREKAGTTAKERK